MSDAATVFEITGYTGAQAALKHPDLVQALYDDGKLVMADALITLHGDEHARRRAVEYGVFSRAFFHRYETEIFPQTLAPLLSPHLKAGWTDLVELGYRLTMNLTADFAGIDRDDDDAEETAALLELVKTFSTGATLVHSTQDIGAVEANVKSALDTFSARFLQKSIQRRLKLLDQGNEPPNDVLSKLLAAADKLPLSDEVLRREMAFYLQAGAHSTANSTTHALHEIFLWAGADPSRWTRLQDAAFVQRCVHESLRLHPASPVAWRRARQTLELEGETVASGTRVTIDLQVANQDQAVFGEDADQFNPDRELPPNVWPFGLTFGIGTHACMGRNLDGGTLPKAQSRHQLGIVTLLVHTLLQHGAHPRPDDTPQRDASTSRNNWGYYPIAFRTAA